MAVLEHTAELPRWTIGHRQIQTAIDDATLSSSTASRRRWYARGGSAAARRWARRHTLEKCVWMHWNEIELDSRYYKCICLPIIDIEKLNMKILRNYLYDPAYPNTHIDNTANQVLSPSNASKHTFAMF